MIRKVNPADAATIAAIYNHYVAESDATFDTDAVSVDDMRQRILAIAQHYPYLVWEEDGRVVGFCYAHGWKTKPAYNLTLETTIYIDPEYARRGIGQRLMLQLIDECRESGFHTLIACITGGNEASVLLHEKLGFKKVSHFESVGLKFGRWLDVVDYQLMLRESR